MRLHKRGIAQIVKQTKDRALQSDVQRRIRVEVQAVESVQIRYTEDIHQVRPEGVRRLSLNVGNGAGLRRMLQESQRYGLKSSGEVAGNGSVGLELPDIKIHPCFECAVILQ